MATIVLPTTPDASKGKYYRLDRCEDEKIIFEEEPNPKAHVPYIIMPNQDFSIDLSMLDLTGLSQDTVSIQGIDFIGSYTSEKLDNQEGFYIDIIDTTPDCSLSPSVETEKGAFLIGALRAYLIVSWEDPYHPGGTRGRGQKMEIVLHDDDTGIAPKFSSAGEGAIYDLSGRKVFGSQLPKGIYIQGGRKKIVR